MNEGPWQDPRQIERMRMFRMAFASYVLWVALAAVGLWTGQLSLPANVIWLTSLGMGLSNLYFYLMLKSGLNRRLRDPSMTMSQIVIAMGWILVLMMSTEQHRGLMIVVYIVAMMFGIFKLSRQEFLKLSALALGGYLAVVLVHRLIHPELFDPSAELLRVLVLGASLLWFSLFGSHVADLRRKIHERNAALHKAVEKAEDLAIRDHLTQSFNRRYIMESLALEKARADRTQETFSVCILDLDHFKSINDQHGHLIGDRVLKDFAHLAKRELRSMDIIGIDPGNHRFGRYGGEEFICVLPGTDLTGARRSAERLRAMTEAEPLEDGLRLTVSAGVAQYHPGESIEDTLKRADHALYEAKKLGRNRVATEQTSRSTVATGQHRVVINGHFGERTGSE